MDFTQYELPPEILLHERRPSLADHQAIQSWVVREFGQKLGAALESVGQAPLQAGKNARMFKRDQVNIMNRERVVRRLLGEHTLEGWELIRLWMVFLRKLLPAWAIPHSQDFLLGGRPIIRVS